MTVRLDEIQLARKNLIKVLRSQVRLKHSLAADEELNELLPAAEKAFNAAVQRGELPTGLDLEAIVAEVIE